MQKSCKLSDLKELLHGVLRGPTDVALVEDGYDRDVARAQLAEERLLERPPRAAFRNDESQVGAVEDETASLDPEGAKGALVVDAVVDRGSFFEIGRAWGKSIICGLDAVALDTALLAGLQARFEGECRDRMTAVVRLPRFDPAWAAQRLLNLAAAWRDQMLEILGAMGLREVRRLRGELGRAMFQTELEREAFAGIPGFAD